MLRMEHRGVLLADGTPHGCLFLRDDATGRPVTTVTPGALDADEHVLFVPEEAEGSLQLLTIPEPIGWDSPSADRWRAYFGDPDAPLLVRYAIDCARLGANVLDGEEVLTSNALAPEVARLCRTMSERTAALKELASSLGAPDPAPGRVVGVDQFGFDLKTKFDVLRVEFEREAGTGDEAAAMIEAMLT